MTDYTNLEQVLIVIQHWCLQQQRRTKDLDRRLALDYLRLRARLLTQMVPSSADEWSEFCALAEFAGKESALAYPDTRITASETAAFLRHYASLDRQDVVDKEGTCNG